MRRFLLLAHRVPVDGAFTLNDLAGGAGRMDEVARAVSTAFTVSNDLRRDTEFTVLFHARSPPAARRIELHGARLRYLNPDERSTAALLKNALVRSATLDRDLEASPGLRVGPADPVRTIEGFAAHPGPLWLTEGGTPLREWAPDTREFAAILSDPSDPTAEESELLGRLGLPQVAVGPRGLRSSQVVDIVHNEFDWREARSGPPTAPAAGGPTR